MSSNHTRDIRSLGLSTKGKDVLPRTDELTPSSPTLGGNLGQTAHEGLVPFGVERDEESARDEVDE
jgi:hypothetical protein